MNDGAIYAAVSQRDMSPEERAEMDAMIRDVLDARGVLIEHKFDIGDAVEKFTGDYVWRGVVCSVFVTPAGKLRYVVAHPAQGYVLHIYSEANLRRAA